jgi:undecaprenyl-diphosphatase
MSVDTRIFLDINDFARDTPWLQPVMSGYANYGVALFAALLLAGWWITRRGGDQTAMAAAVWAPIGMLAAVALNQPLAAAVDATRPCNALHGILVLHCNTDPGFPSDHAVMAGAVTAGVWLVNRRLGALAALAAALLAFARVYIGAHYPQDVLAGLVFGAAVTLIGFALARPLLAGMLTIVERTPARVLLTTAPADPVAAQHQSR